MCSIRRRRSSRPRRKAGKPRCARPTDTVDAARARISLQSAGGATLKLLPDDSILAAGKNPQADTYTITARNQPAERSPGCGLKCCPTRVCRTAVRAATRKAISSSAILMSRLRRPAIPGSEAGGRLETAKADESQDGYDISGLMKKDNSLRGWAIDADAHRLPCAARPC